MNPLDKIHNSWKPYITDLLISEPHLKFLVEEVLIHGGYYPNREDIFNVFQMPIQDIKVVIIGQDPYPQPNQAIGYSFAVNKDIPKPASLKIIEKELGHEIDRTLQSWRDQGVFLLNAALTVKSGVANSHSRYWEYFTKKVVEYISTNHYCTWLLWGRNAQRFQPYICKGSPIVKAPHPAAEAYNPGAGFIGSGCFNKVNETLEAEAKSKINW